MRFAAVIDRIEGDIAVCIRDSDGAVFHAPLAEGFSENEKVCLCICDECIKIEKSKEEAPKKESNKERLRRLFDRKNKDG
ncbi:MAG: hypothetical protein E7575_06500 [Ruminococcaceae bacterium]|nr:hypothetical protein [Oscillospiraceae bacterium]